MMLAIPAALLLLALVVMPRLWVLSVMRRHAGTRAEIPWTGGEFARLLLDRMKLTKVKVEETERGDHYHPLAKSVRLSAENFHGRSLTAVVVAAHEVGHAMQDATGYSPLQTRTRVAGAADFVQKAGTILIIASPALAAILRHPGGMLIGLVAAVLMNLTARRVRCELQSRPRRAQARTLHPRGGDGRGAAHPLGGSLYLRGGGLDRPHQPAAVAEGAENVKVECEGGEHEPSTDFPDQSMADGRPAITLCRSQGRQITRHVLPLRGCERLH